MEIITNAVIVKDAERIEIFPIKVTEHNFIKVRKTLEFQKFVIISILKNAKETGQIKSIWRPKNKKIQHILDELVSAKHQIDKSVNKIKEMFK